MIDKIKEILQMGIKPDGCSFYTDEEKAELLFDLFNKENKQAFDRGWQVGYTRGEKDDKIPSGW